MNHFIKYLLIIASLVFNLNCKTLPTNNPPQAQFRNLVLCSGGGYYLTSGENYNGCPEPQYAVMVIFDIDKQSKKVKENSIHQTNIPIASLPKNAIPNSITKLNAKQKGMTCSCTFKDQTYQVMCSDANYNSCETCCERMKAAMEQYEKDYGQK